MGSASFAQAQSDSKKPSISYGESATDLSLDLIDALKIYVEWGANAFINAPDSTKNTFFRSPSIEVGAAYPLPLFQSKKLYFVGGIAWRQSTLDWKRNHQLTNAQPRALWTPIIPKADHEIIANKLSLNYLSIPLALLYSANKKPGKGWQLAVGGTLSYLVSARQKIKQRDENRHVIVDVTKRPYPIRPWQYACTIRTGIHGFSIYGRYQFSPLFQKNEGPAGVDNARYFSLGVRFTP